MSKQKSGTLEAFAFNRLKTGAVVVEETYVELVR